MPYLEFNHDSRHSGSGSIIVDYPDLFEGFRV
jgi:hypothetical protein